MKFFQQLTKHSHLIIKMPKPYHDNFNKPSNLFNIDNGFNKKIRSLKKYCPSAYKYMTFELKNKKYFLNLNDGIHFINLPTSDEFRFVYGQIKLKVNVLNGNIIYEDIEPSQFFIDGYVSDLDIYKSMYYRNSKDKFKIDLMLEMKKRRKYK